jgi:hypothetical protein
MKKLIFSLLLALTIVGSVNTTVAFIPPFPGCLPCPPDPPDAGGFMLEAR